MKKSTRRTRSNNEDKKRPKIKRKREQRTAGLQEAGDQLAKLDEENAGVIATFCDETNLSIPTSNTGQP